MSLATLLPELNKLSRAEKLQAIQFLAHELESYEDNSENPLGLNREHEIWSPQDMGGAVSALYKLLREKQIANDNE